MSDFQPNYVLVSPLPMDITTETLLQYFGTNYGEVENVGLHTEQTHRFAIVIFKKSADALKAASPQSHAINGHATRATLPDAYQKPIGLLSMPDDCLLDIMGHLRLKDLCSVASACERLQQLAQEVFLSKWRETSVIVNNVEEARNYLGNFGPITQSICLIATAELPKSDHNRILNLLAQYCSEMLTYLELQNITFEKTDGIIAESRTLFPGVETLILKQCTISVKWFIKSRDLIELDLTDTHVTYNGARNQKCPSLETLTIRGSFTWVQKGLHLFLQENNQLKTLAILPRKSCDISSYGRIIDFVPERIECLTTVSVGMADFTRFVSLKKLRIVNDYSRTSDFITRLATNGTLEHLQFYFRGFLSGSSADAIARLRRIKTLYMNFAFGYESVSVLHIVENLRNLSQLVLSSYYNTVNADDILDLIQRGPNLLLLGLAFAFNRDLCENYEKKLEINAETYGKMLNAVRCRLNEKPLQIVIFYYQHRQNWTEVTFPMESSLKITCFAVENHAAVICDCDGMPVMTDEVLKKLRDRGLLDSVPEIEF